MCNKESKKILCIIFNVLFSYANHFFCIYFILRYVLWNDLYINQQYSKESYDGTLYDNTLYDDMNNMYVLLILFIYWINALHTTCLGYKCSRHFVFLNVHIIMYCMLYIILNLQSIKNKSCEQRYLFTCYENKTIYEIDDTAIDNSITIIGYIIAWLLLMNILIIIYMINDNNYKKIYYFTINNIGEFFGLIIVYNITTYCYFVFPMIIGCIIFSSNPIEIPDNFTFLNGRVMSSSNGNTQHTTETNNFVKSSQSHHITYTESNKIHTDPESPFDET